MEAVEVYAACVLLVKKCMHESKQFTTKANDIYLEEERATR
jgi:hypothetical protein